jgi:aryl-alcohol dehydrogenase-like predicted oxidoreductase
MFIPLRNFGKTGVSISALGFGGNHLGTGVRPTFSGYAVMSSSLLKSDWDRSIWRMFHMSPVVD